MRRAPGRSLKVEVLKVEVTGLDDSERRLRALVAAASDLTPVMKDIGEHLLNTTRERFKDEQGPLGAPWAPLSEHTKRRKKRNAGRILTRDGYLGGTLAVEAGRVYPRVSGGTWAEEAAHIAKRIYRRG